MDPRHPRVTVLALGADPGAGVPAGGGWARLCRLVSATHLRGVHCTSGMQVEADGLSRAVVAWIEQVQDAAVTYHDWQEQPTLSDARGIERGRAALPPLRATEDMRSIAVSRLTPPA